MKKYLIALFTLSLFIFSSCDIEKTKEGELPEVDVDVETKSGTFPKYEIDWVDLDLGTKTKIVSVPTIEIVMEEKEIEVPYIDAKWPSGYDDIVEQSIMVEAEVTGNSYDLEIQEVYAKDDRLIVISSLLKEDDKIGDKVMRVSDQILINTPDLTVKHYVMGDKPLRSFNNNYTYISSKAKIQDKIEDAKKIYG